MERLFNLILGATLMAASAVVAPAIASAAPHPRVAPLDCRNLVAKVGGGRVWQAAFAGSRGGPGTWEMYERTYSVSCFMTQAACVDWLYWQQSDWPHENSVGRCRKGTPYGL